jgi:hypothetical protein
MRTLIQFVCLAVLAVCFGASSAQATDGLSRGQGLRQAVIGNQVVTLDRFGNVVARSFINQAPRTVVVNRAPSRAVIVNRGFAREVVVDPFAGRNVTVVNNRSLFSIGGGRRSLADRLIFGF